jgi:hypothetical protein
MVDEPEIERVTGYAMRLAEALHAKHYPENAAWRPLRTLLGLLTQIDNMTAALTRTPPEVSEEMVERFSKIFADASGYYVPFHRGLSSPSADKLRAGVRAILAALKGE